MNEIGWFNVPKFARAPEQEMKMACALLLGNLSHEGMLVLQKSDPPHSPTPPYPKFFCSILLCLFSYFSLVFKSKCS